ncbi:MAG TPA: hypothetical protein VFT44_04925 [Pyrinomonadaceae bacterium]|nr:hypothetical protein [Pyrinomonadaceae bacterium]
MRPVDPATVGREGVPASADAGLVGDARDLGGASGSLLNDMHQLVRQEATPMIGAGRELSRRKHHVSPHGVGACAHGARGRARAVTGMDLDIAKVVAEPRLKESASGRVERLTGGS